MCGKVEDTTKEDLRNLKNKEETKRRRRANI
jgi:hypothetical protein